MDSNAASQMMEKFWADWFSMMGNAQAGDRKDGGARPEAPTPSSFLTADAMRQFQQTFLDSLSKYCDDYMRSPQFLGVMKQSMDNALAFRQQLNEFLDTAAASGFAPPGGAQVDQAVIVDAVRETERKLRDHIEALSARLDRIEARLDGRTGT